MLTAKSRRQARAAALQRHDWSAYHATTATSYLDPCGRDVLVIGCNRGEECRVWSAFGARRVVGLDVMDEIGAHFAAPHVSYVKASAEQMPFADRSFDVVYAFATLEHVPDIDAAFREMMRVCRVGGLVYSVASPLWNSRQGPHWGDVFNDAPWPHLRFSLEEAHAFNQQRRAEGLPSISDEQMAYTYAPAPFNRRWAREYLAAGARYSEAVIRNDIEEDAGDAKQELIGALRAQGFDQRELFGLTHTFIARPGGAAKVSDFWLALADVGARKQWLAPLQRHALGRTAIEWVRRLRGRPRR